LLRARKPRPRQAGFSCLQKNREIQEITAMPFQKGESGNPAGRPREARNRVTVLSEAPATVPVDASSAMRTAGCKNERPLFRDCSLQ
jgi:hypothetical protein